MLFTEAFREYDAKLKNLQWSVCAENPDGELVVSLWAHFFCDQAGNTIKYKDNVNRWSGPGNSEFRIALDKVKQENQTIRVVIVTASDPKVINEGGTGNKVQNSFSIKKNWYGQLTIWNGEDYQIDFEAKND